MQRKWVRALLGALGLCAIVALLVWLYSSSGGGARDRLMTLMLINLISVLGFQIFIGNTGIMSFGQVSFAAIGAYTTAILTTPVMIKSFRIANAPFNLDEKQVSVGISLLITFVLVFILAALVGSVIVRLPPLSATIVTLSWIIVVHAVIINWKNLTCVQTYEHSRLLQPIIQTPTVGSTPVDCAPASECSLTAPLFVVWYNITSPSPGLNH